MATRVIVAEDNVLMRQGIIAALTSLEGIELIADCGDANELRRLVDADPPDVVLTDIRMPPTNTDEGIVAAHRIRSDHPNTGVIILSQHADPEYALSLFDEGTDRLGYLLKENIGNIAELRRAINTVTEGGSPIDPQIVGLLVSRRSASPSPLDHLSPRELEVLEQIAEGLNNVAIAEQLSITEKSVQKHINSIFSKLYLNEEPDAHRRVRAVRLWLAEQS